MPTSSESLTLKQQIIGMVATLVFVIIVRETCVIIFQPLGLGSASNLIGMIVMLVILLTWRFRRGWHNGLPLWLTNSSNIWLKDSGFAFLPISAGAGLLLFGLGEELWRILAILAISTCLPLWAFAHLAERWLNENSSDTGQS